MVNSYAKRLAFSMIELIFAIVIIGITVVSVPIMTNAIGEGVENNLVQEAIFAASAEMNQVLSYRWDENSIDESVDVNATGLAKVIDSSGDCLSSRLKPGHVNQPYHRRCLDSNTTTISLGPDGNETTIDDIDDNIGSNDLFIGGSSSDAYKKYYKYTVNVTKSDMDGNLNNTSNAKEVTVTVLDNNGVITSLKSYTFNIGEIDYYKRLHP